MRALAGTGTLTRLALRRDRIRLPVWTLITLGLVASTAASITDLYSDPAQRQQHAETAGSNPASVAISGPAFGAGTLGGITVSEMAAVAFTIVAIVSLMLVVRHTRKEEETGRSEVVRSAVVGRHAPLAAALLVVGGFNVVVSAGTVAALVGYGLPTPGSVAFGLQLAAVGLVFASVAAVTAQLVEHARTANGSAAALFGLAFLLRAMGDATHAASDGSNVLRNLSWLSPIGWAQQTRAYDNERWWVFGLLGAAILVLIGAAVMLNARRDFGAGLLPARLGRAEASPRLGSAWGLAWRLQRPGLIGWAVGIVAGAAVFASFAQDVNNMIGGNAEAARIFAEIGGAGALVDNYLVWLLSLTGIAVAAYAVFAVLRLRSEETDLRAEPLLAAGVKRRQWLASHAAVAVIGTVVMLAGAGAAAGLVHGIRSGNAGDELPRILAGALVQIPAVLFVAAATVALFGLVPRLSAGGWLLVGAAALISQVGVILQLAQWALNVSPFTHVPNLPGGEATATPLIWLGTLTVALAAAGLFWFRQRDINTS